MSAPNNLRAALASVDEQTLATYLRVSIAALRRYATGELKMNWVISTRLAALPTQPAVRPAAQAPQDRHRVARTERRTSRRTPLAAQAVAV